MDPYIHQFSADQLQPASFLRRAASTIIDSLFIALVVTMVATAATFVFIPEKKSVVTFALAAICYLLYEPILLTTRGSTLGRMLMHIWVIDEKSFQISFRTAMIRSISRVLSGIGSIGFYWMLVDKRGQTWHDKIAGTRVIKVDNENVPIPGHLRTISAVHYVLFAILTFASVLTLTLRVGRFAAEYGKEGMQISGKSMEPTFYEKDVVLLNRSAYERSVPNRNDIVLFTFPKAANCPPAFGCTSIKRIAAVPGDKVVIIQNKFYVNNTEYSIPNVPPTSVLPANFLIESIDFILPEDHYFVLGDNPDHSTDSRIWGPVPRENILGQITEVKKTRTQPVKVDKSVKSVPMTQ